MRKEAREITFGVAGLACGGCAGSLERRLRVQGGVADARVDFSGKRAVLRYDPDRTQPEELARAIRSAGYEVTG